MIQLTELENGDLEIKITNKEEFIELLSKQLSEDEILAEMLESGRYIGNDWYCNQRIGLTDTPNICDGAHYAIKDPNKINDYLELIKEGIYDIGIDFKPKSFRCYLEQDCDIEPELSIDFENVWCYFDYMTKSFITELKENEFVIFERFK